MKAKLGAIVLIMAVLLFSCTQYVIVPLPGFGNGGEETHTHDFGEEPINYEMIGGQLYAIYQCSCGEKQRIAVGSASNTIDLRGSITEDQFEAIEEGSVVITDNVNAQAVLDHIKSGVTVYFAAGTYTGFSDPDAPEGTKMDRLAIRPSRYNGAEIYIGTWAQEEGWKKGEKLEYVDDTNIGELANINFYDLTLQNITLIGDDNAVFQTGFDIKAGHQYQNSSNGNPYDAVKEIYQTNGTGNSYYAGVVIDGISFHNMHFEGFDHHIAFDFYDTKDSLSSSVSNVLIEGCTFTDTEENNPGDDNAATAIAMRADDPEKYNNIVVRNCSFYNVYQGVYVQGAENMTVENCTFDTTVHNAVAVQSSSNNVFSGDILVTGCAFSNIGDRVIRFGNGENVDIVVSGNDFTTCSNIDGELTKAASLVNGTFAFIDNIYAGEPIPESSIGTVPECVVTVPE